MAKQRLGVNRLRIENFKAIRNADLELKGLNYLLGENSLGKSSVSQALLLLTQNLRDSGAGKFKFNGSVVKMGSMDEVYKRDSSGPLAIGVGIHFENYIREDFGDQLEGELTSSLSLEVGSVATHSSEEKSHSGTGVESFSYKDRESTFSISGSNLGEVQVTGSFQDKSFPQSTFGDYKELGFTQNPLKLEAGEDGGLWSNLKSPVIDVEELQTAAERMFASQQAPPTDRICIDVELVDALFFAALANGEARLDELDFQSLVEKFVNFFESGFKIHEELVYDFVNGDSSDWPFSPNVESFLWGYFVDVYTQEEYERATAGSVYIELRLVIDENSAMDALNALAKTILAAGGFSEFWVEQTELRSWDWMRLNQRIENASQFLVRNLHYLGPLRVDGYSLQKNDAVPESLAPIGTRGEYLAQTIAEHCIPQKSKSQILAEVFKRNAVGGAFPTASGGSTNDLQGALESWTEYFGLGASVTFNEIGVRGFDMRVDGTSLYQLGSGVSQILPVLGICLLAKPGSLTILEQPELHLHPGAQQKLADFFMAMSASGRNLLIETHSEYMVTRTRRAVALKQADPDQIQLFFAEKGVGETLIKRADLNGSGGFNYWPVGFFSQTEDDLLAIIEALGDPDNG